MEKKLLCIISVIGVKRLTVFWKCLKASLKKIKKKDFINGRRDGTQPGLIKRNNCVETNYFFSRVSSCRVTSGRLLEYSQTHVRTHIRHRNLQFRLFSISESLGKSTVIFSSEESAVRDRNWGFPGYGLKILPGKIKPLGEISVR